MSYLSLKDSERDAADDRPLSDYIAKANLLNDVGVANLLAHRDFLMKENERLRDALKAIICNGPMSYEEHSERSGRIAREALKEGEK